MPVSTAAQLSYSMSLAPSRLVMIEGSQRRALFFLSSRLSEAHGEISFLVISTKRKRMERSLDYARDDKEGARDDREGARDDREGAKMHVIHQLSAVSTLTIWVVLVFIVPQSVFLGTSHTMICPERSKDTLRDSDQSLSL